MIESGHDKRGEVRENASLGVGARSAGERVDQDVDCGLAVGLFPWWIAGVQVQ
ncbi:hypothetical protein DSM3645_21117 [Blastopirellula marina DSM 3645]|uniref:Uncharacterized protein n=1 Tax=Blastopirellula marina DSM 3645 TaxID=314230 RepID=A3ZR20_9BACT|nr:hypothetical protein DSM3645_21117 [Blastopirellula marina DSM 3645]